jgi:monoamine oxidase
MTPACGDLAVERTDGAILGRLHFSGEHTSVLMPGMEGALESAERAVRAIVVRVEDAAARA